MARDTLTLFGFVLQAVHGIGLGMAWPSFASAASAWLRLCRHCFGGFGWAVVGSACGWLGLASYACLKRFRPLPRRFARQLLAAAGPVVALAKSSPCLLLVNVGQQDANKNKKQQFLVCLQGASMAHGACA